MSNLVPSSESLGEEVLRYYSQGNEAARLAVGIGPLEYARTKELIGCYIAEPPQVVVDVGGGPGAYACWLAREGHEVHLVDAVPLHVDQARRASDEQPHTPLTSCRLGDARQLQFADNFADVVLLNGPLYHLLEKRQRLLALKECRRIMRPAGLLLATGISRFASLHVGLARGWIDDEDFQAMVKSELADGRHIPPQSWPALFTTAYFHLPDELTSEIVEAGFGHIATLAIEGAGWLAPDLEQRWQVPQQRQAIMKAVRWSEREKSVMGISPHFMGVARKQATIA